MMRAIAILLALLHATAVAEWPYDACCQVNVPPYAGAGTLVGVSNGRGLVVTCHHVVEEGNLGAITCRFPTRHVSRGRLLGSDARLDLAAIDIDAPPGTASTRSVGAAIDSQLIVVGTPWYGNGRLYWMRGRLIGRGGQSMAIACPKLVQSGYSGGAVLSPQGDLVGVIWGHDFQHSQATDGELVKAFLSRWMKTE